MNNQSPGTERLHLLPYGDDPLWAMAQSLLQTHRARLPRLDHVTILLPDATAAGRLREVLLEQSSKLGFPALLGPNIQSLHSWLNRYDIENIVTVSDYRRELILLAALRRHSELFGEGNLWSLVDSLLTLFDELTLNRVGLPRDLSEFTRRVASGYGLQQSTHQALDKEAQLVHTLWHAWHDELNERGLIDRNTRYLLQLAASAKDTQNSQHDLYLLAPVSRCQAEREWLAGMMQSGRVELFIHGNISADSDPRPFHPEAPLRELLKTLHAEKHSRLGSDAYSRLLDTVFSSSRQHADMPLRERAARFATEVADDPLADRLRVYSADSDEDEARAVELQVRRRLLEGRRRIGIVTENRRLARRVRALLERADIHLEDAAGWALSTTSAAAVLERWLQCVEEDFPHRAMLDLLKSPFFIPDDEREAHLEQVYRLEQDIVLHENIGSGLERYRKHLKYRRQRLPTELAEQLDPVGQLLDKLKLAAVPLQPHRHTAQSDAAELLGLLLQSLETLGITRQLGADAAGMRLLEELEKMHQAVAHETLGMDWQTFRNWLGRSLERYNFQPTSATQTVSLSGLSQTPAARFDALILSAVEREHLPGNPAATPFFNNAVRLELGLPTADDHLSVRFYHFRRLLEAAPRILITHRQHHDGEEVAPSPWLELLQAFHQLAYRSPLSDTELERLLADPNSQTVRRRHPLPRQSEMPRPALHPPLIPHRYSASAYQQLMDCPYQFLAARGLGLAAPDSIREALEKSDYGERVHRCLQAFHGNIEGLPGPYTGAWEERRRNEAIALLEKISKAVFAEDLEDNFMHRGWLQRWLARIPEYIDWQIERASTWQVESVEQKLEREHVIDGLTLHGRLDRCDSNGEQLAVVDYKTGYSPAAEEVLSGEAVQLPFYALLADKPQQTIGRVEYLPLDDRKVAGKSILQEPELSELSQAVAARLETLHQLLVKGAELPAWGDEKTCKYCRMSGICRRQAWAGQ
ncbi:MAG: PD-(D/E)XK nuclease family protein [Pseudomonadota bacterium]